MDIHEQTTCTTVGNLKAVIEGLDDNMPIEDAIGVVGFDVTVIVCGARQGVIISPASM